MISKRYCVFLIVIYYLLLTNSALATILPGQFVYLRDIDPTIVQDIRYAGWHNFVGRPIVGYQSATCILTRPAAKALADMQKELRPRHLSLKVFDCYRPQRAVNDFMQWSQHLSQQQMKAEFYPRVDKRNVFRLGYVAAQSGHTRGSTVDLTLIKLPPRSATIYHRDQILVACYAPYQQRFFDGGIDMGTGFDCLDPSANINNTHINAIAYKNRQLLRNIMMRHGFIPYAREWWHFTFKNEPYKNTYFNFPVSGSKL